MTDGGLFDIDPGWVSPAGVDPPVPELSAGRRLTLRQAADLDRGFHPLTGTRLHERAAPAEDRQADGTRCGTCRFREPGTYPKCTEGKGRWISHGPATDCRAWWPACTHYEPRTDD